MKKIILLFTAILMSASLLSAAESACPADRAATDGHEPFGRFHEIMAPAWHVAWPEKDFDALIAAGPQFAEVFKEIEAMNPELKTEILKNHFRENREKFASVMKAYVEACEAKNKEKVYELMPDLHDTFEMTASVLLPVYYPQFDGFVISFNLLYESHIPANNIEGIKGTTETLLAKFSGLNSETIPAELKELEKKILADFNEFGLLLEKISRCCDSEDYEKLKEYAAILSKKIETFVADYI